MAMILCFADSEKAITSARSTVAASIPLQPASIETAKPVVASRKMRP